MKYRLLKTYLMALVLTFLCSLFVACGGGDSEPVDPVDSKAEIYFETNSDLSVTGLMDCSSIDQVLEGFDPANVYGLTETLRSQISFAQTLFDSGNEVFDVDGISVLFSPVDYLALEYTIISEPSVEPAVDIGNSEEGKAKLACIIPKTVSYVSNALKVTVNEKFINWASKDAIRNQSDYDAEESEIFKSILGENGLGFGLYVKGGIQYEFEMAIPTVDTSYNQLSVHYGLDDTLNKTKVGDFLPNGIQLIYNNAERLNCSQIDMRIGRDQAMEDASIFARNILESCKQKPIFAIGEDSAPSIDPEEEFIKYLEGFRKFNLITKPLTGERKFKNCNPLDTISNEGCSQPIVMSYQPIIQDFLAERSDLYIEIYLGSGPGSIKKLLFADRYTGELSELESHILTVSESTTE